MFSTKEQLKTISKILTGYLKLPLSVDKIPGELMENVVSEVHGGEVLKTYDFVDVVNSNKKYGWQVKSTKASSPLTWKRAKIPNAVELIKASQEDEGLQKLGDAIIKYCNDHALKSMKKYKLNKIRYSRLILHKDGKITYFEKTLCTKKDPKIFDESHFEWKWSIPKKTKKKEQLPALHGTHKDSGKKWFAWHGLSENQLHFSGEYTWWPANGNNEHTINFNFPNNKVSQAQLMDLLTEISTND